MHVLITGASSGIGRALALEYHRAGAAVTLVARRREALEALSQELKDRCAVVVRDVAAEPLDLVWVKEAESKLGPVDVLINNAGTQVVGAAVAIEPRDAEALLRLNLTAPLLLARAVLPGMLERGSGAIVNISSMAGVAPARGMTWYGASKAGLASFSEALRAELQGTGVNVLTVFPGPVETPMAAGAREALAKAAGTVPNVPHGDPAVLAKLIREGVEKRKATIVYPAFHLIRFTPWFGKWLTARAAPKINPRG